ncbi:MAG: hypothetical protein JW384_02674 [Nitrosomonadaceae bacterium]|nr:hypothetical protein [Nitrosomonadaceae bacterium]
MKQKTERRCQWSEDELVVLAAVYISGSFSMGDDERDECQTMAACFGRTASAIDRQWRNMDAVVKGKTGFNIGRLVAEAALRFVMNPAANRRIALGICSDRGWPLVDLILHGRQEEGNKPIILSLSRDDRMRLESCCHEVQFKIFPSGSQGFGLNSSVVLSDGSYSVSISAVLAQSKANPHLHIKTSPETMSQALQKLVKDVAPKTFVSGRVGYYGSVKLILGSDNYRVTIRAVPTGGHE